MYTHSIPPTNHSPTHNPNKPPTNQAREQTPLSFTRDLHRAATTPSIPSEEETPEGEKDVDWEDEGWEARKGLAPLNFHAAHTGTMGAPAGRMMGQQQQDVIEVGPAELVRSWLAGCVTIWACFVLYWFVCECMHIDPNQSNLYKIAARRPSSSGRRSRTRRRRKRRRQGPWAR